MGEVDLREKLAKLENALRDIANAMPSEPLFIVSGPASVSEGPAPWFVIDLTTGKIEGAYTPRSKAEERAAELNRG
jgi:hypothetical protein